MRMQLIPMAGERGGLSRLLLWTVLLLAIPMISRLDAAFIAPYAPGNFSLTNTNADGFIEFRLDGSLVITGGNTGSGLDGSTNLLVSSAGNGMVSFNFAYFTLDDVLAEVAGYMVGGTFTQLADRNGAAGPVSFSVTSGQTFGFRIDTADNQGEPGYLTITNFQAPSGPGGPPVPEPSTWLAGLAGLALLLRQKMQGVRS